MRPASTKGQNVKGALGALGASAARGAVVSAAAAFTGAPPALALATANALVCDSKTSGPHSALTAAVLLCVECPGASFEAALEAFAYASTRAQWSCKTVIQALITRVKGATQQSGEGRVCAVAVATRFLSIILRETKEQPTDDTYTINAIKELTALITADD